MRPSKAIGIAGASIGFLGSVTFTGCLILADNGSIPFLSENYRTYHGEYYVDDVLVYETTQQRGTEIDTKSIDTQKHSTEEGRVYTFIGWDLTGDHIPDVAPTHMYYNFKANACYLDFKLPDIDFSKIDVKKLLEFLENFDISLEDLLQFLNMDMQDFLDWLGENDFEMPSDFTAYSESGFISPYFRQQSYGDWNTKKNDWDEADYFNAKKVCGVVDANPLNFTADKISNSILASSKYQATIEYTGVKAPYPGLAYECRNYNIAESDAYVTTNDDKHYVTSGFPLVFSSTTLDIIDSSEFYDSDCASAEYDYRNYAKEHYTNVPDKYKDLFSNIVTSVEFNNFVKNSYSTVNEINNIYAYIMDFCNFKSEDIIDNYVYPAKVDPIENFVETRKGSAKHIANFATMLYRYVGIPARFVEGYLAYDQIGNKSIECNFAHKWGWTEVYLEGTGWIALDCCSYFGGKDGNSGNGDLSTDVPMNGPGSKGPSSSGGDVGDFISFESPDYTGTVYFRSRSLDKYVLGNWSSTSNTNSYRSYNPLSFGYYSGNFYNDNTFNVTYLKSANYGAAPEYSNVSSTGTDDVYIGKVKEGEEKKFQSKVYTLNDETYPFLLDQLDSNKYYGIYEDEYQITINSSDRYTTILNDTFSDYEYDSIKQVYEVLKLMCDEALNSFFDFECNNEILRDILLVKRYLQTEYNYNVNYSFDPSLEDPLIGFYQTREGVCSSFATAATLMLRMLGYKARYVVGFVGSSIANKTCYINSKSAHAWTEVYLDGIGWLTVDCTGFGEGNGSIDPTVPDNDYDYGDHPSGGGTNPASKQIKINYLMLAQTVDFTGTKVKTSQIDKNKFMKIVSKNSDEITQKEFDNKYYFEILDVDCVPYAADGNEKHKVDFIIREKSTNANVTYMFVNAKTGKSLAVTNFDTSIVNSYGQYASEYVKFNFLKSDLTIHFPDMELNENEITTYLDFVQSGIEVTGLKNIQNDTIYISEEVIVDIYSATLVRDGDNAHHYEFKVSVECYYVTNPNSYPYVRAYADVTRFYNIECIWGKITPKSV